MSVAMLLQMLQPKMCHTILRFLRTVPMHQTDCFTAYFWHHAEVPDPVCNMALPRPLGACKPNIIAERKRQNI
jgi:hypothetical protein